LENAQREDEYIADYDFSWLWQTLDLKYPEKAETKP
jgi:hypothetical protein